MTILGIESSCDDTAAAIVDDGFLLSSTVADQDVHKKYGGVVPELASRAHQQNIIPVVDLAIQQAGIEIDGIQAVAFTRGPGLLGSLLVGTSFAKGFALARNVPLIEVNHLQAHIVVHFIKEHGVSASHPPFPFLCLLVSGGHTQLVIVHSHLEMEVIGQTIDDAAGEAFDKCAKIMGLPYPGGPMVDELARLGDPSAFGFTKPKTDPFNFSFSGLKTNFLYFIQDQLKQDEAFIENRKNDLCASLQFTIIRILMEKLILASEKTGIRSVALAGGVSANSGLRTALGREAGKRGWDIYIPEVKFTMDNAAMIAATGYFKYLAGDFTGHDISPAARLPF